MNKYLNYILPLLSIADISSNTEAEKRQHSFLIYMGLLMSTGGLLWGILCIHPDNNPKLYLFIFYEEFSSFPKYTDHYFIVTSFFLSVFSWRLYCQWWKCPLVSHSCIW